MRCAPKIGWLALVWLLLLSTELSAQERLPVLFELEAGIERLDAGAVRAVFPAGGSLKIGAVFAVADQGRLRLRPNAGVKVFFNELDEWTTEHLRLIRLGGQVSYDLFFVGQTTFFPYVAADFNWVANYDAESDGGSGDDEQISFSEHYLRGTGFSQEVGVRAQYREFYVKLGYEIFNPRLKIRSAIVEEDLAAGYRTPRSHPFNFNTLNLSIGVTVGL